MTATLPATRFELPPGREATMPPERRGLDRDEVRLLVARPGAVEHRTFRDLPDVIEPGDLLVINTSATLPAAVDARRSDGRRVPVHVAMSLEDGAWVVEVRRLDGRGPEQGLRGGERLRLRSGVLLTLRTPYPDDAERPRLWRATSDPATDAAAFLMRYGRPITYGYLGGEFPIADYQTVYATVPGSAEMPSAGRPFTETLLVRLLAQGVTVAPIVLHAAVSSPEAHEPPLPEWYDVPAVTARLVNSARAAGQRVVAVGTTVVRALETAAGADGRLRPGRGWTDRVVGPAEPARVVNGLITGLHPPGASHLLLLEAVGGPGLVGAAYRSAVEHGYLWHEFGDATVLLP